MKTNNTEKPAGRTGSTLWSSLTHSLSLSWTILALANPLSAHADNAAHDRMSEKVKAGDILYVDSGNAVDGGGLFKLDGKTGERTVLSMGGELQMPFAVTMDSRSGLAIVSDSCRLIAVDPATGKQAVLM